MTSPGLTATTARMWSVAPAPFSCRWRTTRSTPRRSGRSCFPRSSRCPADRTPLRLDAIGPQRLKAVEAHRGIHRRIGPGGEDLDLVPRLEVERQLVLGPLVEDVGTVAGWSCQNRRPQCSAVGGRADPVLDALVHGLDEAIEFTHVEVDPALFL